MTPEELKQYVEFSKKIADNIDKISFGAFISACSVVIAWIKLHKKFIVDPREEIRKEAKDKIEALQAIFDESYRGVKSDAISNYNRIKEIDQLLELQDDRIEKLEREDRSVIAQITENTNKIDVFRERLLGSETKYNELKEALAELRRTDSERQQAMGKIQGILEFMVKN